MGLSSRRRRERRERRDAHIAQLERELLPELVPPAPQPVRVAPHNHLQLVAAPKTTMIWDVDLKTGGLVVTPRTEQEWKRSMLHSSAVCVASANVPGWDREYRRLYGA